MLIGVCSNDVLFSLSSDEISSNQEGNRLARLAGHLLQQQSFSPQFPVPKNLLSQVSYGISMYIDMYNMACDEHTL